ncbi:DUF2326 domain-containing protein [Treponema sp. OMZ 788]|uniref:DUF2326 domain-containing protein n=1 Tax=Treponema sp. OMZ 788 TaxID=2563664 RepID=UPI0020A38FDC|nr:DUF2326 domain-containing protein [Treponema sp. OMZ 788]
MPLKQFHDFLKEKYMDSSNDISFRETISPFFRIYQRNNSDEHNPFRWAKEESEEKCIIRLIKLYGLYTSIQIYHDLVKKNTERLTTYRNAQKREFIPKINAKTYKQNEKTVKADENALENIATGLYKNVVELENLEVTETIRLKNTLAALRSKLTKYKNRFKYLNDIQAENKPPFLNDQAFYTSLKEFFPNANVRKLSEVDEFHNSLFNILNKEVNQESENLNILIKECENQINDLSKELETYPNEKAISKTILKNIENIIGHKQQLTLENNSYDTLKALEKDKKDSIKKLDNIIGDILLQIQNKINTEVSQLNTFLYSADKRSPSLSLSRKSYKYTTFNDSGTGTNYKNLILLDICLLKQTFLPALIHDSLLFKNIADEPIENIFKLYAGFNKQIFIAFDKLNTYPANVQKVIKDNFILQLGDNEKALFGFTWNNKENG